MIPAIIGVDPGLDGGMVLMVGGAALRQVMIRDITDGWRPGNAALVADHVREMIEDADGLPMAAYVERVSCRPGQGAPGVLTAGVGWGLVVGAIVACGVRVVDVTPPAWRRAAGFPARPSTPEGRKLAKGDAIAWATQVPGLNLRPAGCRVAHSGLADAACIAYAGANLEARLRGEVAP